jgi:short subunit dehydrogenase-like uncharacterized protein
MPIDRRCVSSDAFSLHGNLAAGDTRAGLDDTAKKDILKIMKKQKVGFDEARQIQLERKLVKNGISADGRPTDPRAVFFS